MHGNMEMFEVIGRGVLNMVLRLSNSQPRNGSSSQPQTSSNPYSRGPNVTQPLTSFVPSSNPSQPGYVQSPPQVPESYSDPNCVDYNALDFLAKADAILQILSQFRSPIHESTVMQIEGLPALILAFTLNGQSGPSLSYHWFCVRRLLDHDC